MDINFITDQMSKILDVIEIADGKAQIKKSVADKIYELHDKHPLRDTKNKIMDKEDIVFGVRRTSWHEVKFTLDAPGLKCEALDFDSIEDIYNAIPRLRYSRSKKKLIVIDKDTSKSHPDTSNKKPIENETQIKKELMSNCFLRVKEVCKILSISDAQLRNLAKAGIIKSVNLSSSKQMSLRFRPSDVRDFISSREMNG